MSALTPWSSQLARASQRAERSASWASVPGEVTLAFRSNRGQNQDRVIGPRVMGVLRFDSLEAEASSNE